MPDGVVVGVTTWEPTVLAGLGAPSVAPQSRSVAAGGVLDSSPSQERLSRIAAMLRDAEQAMPVITARDRQERREQRLRQLRRVA